MLCDTIVIIVIIVIIFFIFTDKLFPCCAWKTSSSKEHRQPSSAEFCWTPGWSRRTTPLFLNYIKMQPGFVHILEFMWENADQEKRKENAMSFHALTADPFAVGVMNLEAFPEEVCDRQLPLECQLVVLACNRSTGGGCSFGLQLTPTNNKSKSKASTSWNSRPGSAGDAVTCATLQVMWNIAARPHFSPSFFSFCFILEDYLI